VFTVKLSATVPLPNAALEVIPADVNKLVRATPGATGLPSESTAHKRT